MVKYNPRKKYRVGLVKNNFHLFTIHSYLLTKYAGMAELADAYDSGSYERKFLRVQVPFPAPNQYNPNLFPLGDGLGFIAFMYGDCFCSLDMI